MRATGVSFLALVLGLLLSPSLAHADELNFTVTGFTPSCCSPSPGNITYSGSGGPLVATDVQIQDVTGVGTPTNNAFTAQLSNALLNFTTGNLSSTNSSSWFFSSGGIITLVGGVDFNNDGDTTDPGDIPDGTTLFSGSFTDIATVTQAGPELKIVIALFGDTKNPDLVSFYGLPTNVPYLGTLEITFNLYAGALPPSGFSSWTIVQGTITNTPVPEPGTMALFGSGMIGLAFAIRRKLLG